MNSKVRRGKITIKIKAEINKIENKKQYKINKMKSRLFKKKPNLYTLDLLRKNERRIK